MSRYYFGKSSDVETELCLKGSLNYQISSIDKINKVRYFYMEFKYKISIKYVSTYFKSVDEIETTVNKNRYKMRQNIIDKGGEIKEIGIWYSILHKPELEGEGIFHDMTKVGHPNYEMNEKAEVRHKNLKQIIPLKLRRGYYNVVVSDKIEKIHRLLAQMFLENPENKPTVDHINGDSTDYKLSNLRWATHTEQRANTRKINNHEDIGVFQFREDKYIKHWRNTKTTSNETKYDEKEIIKACENQIIFNGYKWYYGNFNDALPGENWKEIKCDTVSIWVSDLGRIKNLMGYTIGHQRGVTGYLYVKIVRNGKKSKIGIHRLVMEAFDKDSKLEVNHKNGNKIDNRIENLEYVTKKENIRHLYMKLGSKSAKSVVKINKEGKIVAKFKTAREADRCSGYGRNRVTDAIRFKRIIDDHTWRHEIEIQHEKIVTKQQIKNKSIISVVRIDIEGNIVDRFNSASEADRELEYRKGAVSRAIRENKTIDEFIWRKEN